MTVVTSALPDLLGTSPADLIDPNAEQPASTRDVAVRRAERIRAGIAGYAAMRQEIADAFAQRDWRALDYASWYEYMREEFGEELAKLHRDERREAVADLRSQGMSTRQIASVTGAPRSTIRDDLKEGGNRPPETVTGSDGKKYPAARPPSTSDEKPSPPPATTPEPERPGPPKWDPEERRAHEAEVQRLQVIRHGQQAAKTIVTDLQTLVVTVVSACREGEKGLVTRQMIVDLRRAIDLLEGELGEQ